MEQKTPSIEQLQSLVVKFCADREWDQFHNPKDIAISLSLEAGEFMEHFQWKNKQEMSEYLLNNTDLVAEELSDVLYWTLLAAHKLDIDLSSAFVNKLTVNAQKYPIHKAKGTHKKYTEL